MVYKGRKKALEDAKYRTNLILDRLKEKKIQTWSELYQYFVDEEKSMGKTTFYEHLKELSATTKKHGKVHKQKLGNTSYYFLPKNKKYYETKEKEFLKKKKLAIRKAEIKIKTEEEEIFSIREKHTESIKKNLIEPLIEEIDKLIHTLGISVTSGCYKIEKSFILKSKLSDDFRKNHLIKDFGNPFVIIDYLHENSDYYINSPITDEEETKEELLVILNAMKDMLEKYLECMHPFPNLCEYVKPPD